MRALASAGAKVTMACRDDVKAIKVASELNQSLGSSLIDSGTLNLESLASVRAFAQSFRSTDDKLDILINNGAVMACPQGLTVDGFEMRFENRPYDSWSSYGQAKTTCALLAVGIQTRFADDGIEGFAVHPRGYHDNVATSYEPV